MPLDPGIADLLADLDGADMASYAAGDVEGLREFLSEVFTGIPGVQIETVEDLSGPVPLRLYDDAPASKAVRPLLLYFHGGGWVSGSIETHDALCRRLAQGGELVVVSVGYSLAPEVDACRQVEECLTVVDWCRASAAKRGWSGDAFVLAGDSAGGHIVACATNRIIEQGRVPPRAQILIYPVLDAPGDRASYREHDGYLLPRKLMDMFWRVSGLASRSPEDGFLPLRHRRLEHTPPTILLSAECDILLSEAQDFAQTLESHGVRVSHRTIDGVVHGFANMTGVAPQADQAIDWIKEETMKCLAGAR